MEHNITWVAIISSLPRVVVSSLPRVAVASSVLPEGAFRLVPCINENGSVTAHLIAKCLSMKQLVLNIISIVYCSCFMECGYRVELHDCPWHIETEHQLVCHRLPGLSFMYSSCVTMFIPSFVMTFPWISLVALVSRVRCSLARVRVRAGSGYIVKYRLPAL